MMASQESVRSNPFRRFLSSSLQLQSSIREGDHSTSKETAGWQAQNAQNFTDTHNWTLISDFPTAISQDPLQSSATSHNHMEGDPPCSTGAINPPPSPTAVAVINVTTALEPPTIRQPATPKQLCPPATTNSKQLVPLPRRSSPAIKLSFDRASAALPVHAESSGTLLSPGLRHYFPDTMPSIISNSLLRPREAFAVGPQRITEYDNMVLQALDHARFSTWTPPEKIKR